ncbi:hypothetical protein BJX64DRAFT_245691 [Aspergillus heterothallicus]
MTWHGNLCPPRCVCGAYLTSTLPDSAASALLELALLSQKFRCSTTRGITYGIGISNRRHLGWAAAALWAASRSQGFEVYPFVALSLSILCVISSYCRYCACCHYKALDLR